MSVAKELYKFKNTIQAKFRVAYINNIIFQLHYSYTFSLLCGFVFLVSSRQLIGEHIHCITDKGVEQKVIDSFCYFTSTFTVVRHLGNKSRGQVPHPGIGPVNDNEPIIHHAYYQWVPYMLFFQAVLFQIPRFFWKDLEGGRLEAMAGGLRGVVLSSGERTKINERVTVPSRVEREVHVKDVSKAFLERLRLNQWWARELIFCEALNLINVISQVWFLQYFLQGDFLELGLLFLGVESGSIMSLDAVFPKVTKCTFHKYGPSGSVERRDALCIMALNVVNEKIYTILWFWFLALSMLSALVLLYRFISALLYCRSVAFNRFVFMRQCPMMINDRTLRTVFTKLSYSNWLFLHYLTKNLDVSVVKELLERIATERENRRTERQRDTHVKKTSDIRELEQILEQLP